MYQTSVAGSLESKFDGMTGISLGKFVVIQLSITQQGAQQKGGIWKSGLDFLLTFVSSFFLYVLFTTQNLEIAMKQIYLTTLDIVKKKSFNFVFYNPE